jgi:acetyl esterase/lipase
MQRRRSFLLLVIFFLSAASIIKAQTQLTTAGWAASFSDRYLMYPDRQYGFASGVPLKLDVWQAKTDNPVPTVIYIHGGGWLFGDRAGAVVYMMPWLERGWNVVNVEYRMSGTALAPAAVEDVRCALRWVYRNAKEYHLDINRILVTGHSAGGHLALMAGMLQPEDGFDNNCPADPVLDVPMKVSAIVNFYGPADVADLLDGPNRKTYAIAWLGGQTDRVEIAKRVSPMAYVRPGLPPILTIHGDADSVVPYADSVRLHEALNKAHVPNVLYTIHGGNHGQFGVDADITAYQEVWRFLAKNVPSLGLASRQSK